MEQKSGNGKKIIFILTIVAIFTSIFFRSWIKTGQENYNNNPINRSYSNITSDSGDQSGNLTQINGDAGNGVEVMAIYEKDKSQNQLFFRLSFSTHVIDYSDYNFQKDIIIKNSQGKEYKASSLMKEGSGHHQSVSIVFPAVSSPFILIVKNLAGVAEREFSF